eukprot:CAMPEP_0119128840 /NCGR_PEP_ID=MMETSP1310-20130426/6831_1 /TAXON_ID=464262 /ORGANISM="Genus nov. species nov., Strain RCC2339" /LENGTH=162 /DNA_ID=CAMNT_0007119213 /DNA_START=138 /DNA_END=623 /DNA_ORIENTATION=-
MDRVELLNEFKECVSNVVLEGSKGEALDSSNVHGVRLCGVLERVLKHGLKDLRFFGETHYFEVLDKLVEVHPPAKDLTLRVRKLASLGDRGKGRAFIATCLNQGCPQLVAQVTEHTELLEEFYQPTAFLRSDDDTSIFTLLLETLARTPFSLSVLDEGVDEP